MSPILRAFLDHQDAIKRLIFRIVRDNAAAEDLAQETFLRAFAAEGTELILAPKSYLMRIAKNLALNERAKIDGRATEYMEDFADPDVLGSGDGPSLQEEVESRAKLRLFAEAVSALPKQCRMVFLMRKVYGLPHGEIAKRLGVAISTVEKHIATGTIKCAEYMRARGYEVGGAERGSRERRKQLLAGDIGEPETHD